MHNEELHSGTRSVYLQEVQSKVVVMSLKFQIANNLAFRAIHE